MDAFMQRRNHFVEKLQIVVPFVANYDEDFYALGVCRFNFAQNLSLLQGPMLDRVGLEMRQVLFELIENEKPF